MLAGGGSNIVPLPPRCCRENNVFPVQRQYFICTRQPRQMAMSETPACRPHRSRNEARARKQLSARSAGKCLTGPGVQRILQHGERRVFMGHLPHAIRLRCRLVSLDRQSGAQICVRDRLRPAPCGQGSPCRPQPSGERHGEVAVGGARLSDRLAREVGNSHAEILGPTLRGRCRARPPRPAMPPTRAATAPPASLPGQPVARRSVARRTPRDVRVRSASSTRVMRCKRLPRPTPGPACTTQRGRRCPRSPSPQ